MAAPKVWTGPKKPKTCIGCGAEFIPHVGKQKWCYPCHKPCPDCGCPKDVRAARCRKCDAAIQEGARKPNSGLKSPPIEKVVASIEALGLHPDRQFAFGYVIGVTFGDGSISVSTVRGKHLCKSGRITICTQTDHRFRLQVTCREFAEALARQWGVLTSITPGVSSSVRTTFSRTTLRGHSPRPLRLYLVSPRNRPLARYLHRLKYEIGPVCFTDFPRQVQLGILCGMIDSEGYVAKKYLDVANKDVSLLKAVQALFLAFGYPTRIYQSPSQRVAHLRLLC